MPTFRSLRERGAWSDMSNPPGLGNSALWASLATGVNPGSHGHFFVYQYRRERYRTTRFRDDEFAVEPFWNRLGRAGKRVAVLDWVGGPLSRGLNGLQLVDYMAHAPRHPQALSWPPELAAEVTSKFGRDPVRQWYRDDADPGRAHRILRDLRVARAEKKAEVASHYLRQGGWDLFATVFGEPHDVGHELWHLHDPSHPLHDADWRRAHGDPLKDVYVALDRAVGRLLDCAGPEATTVVFAGAGMGPDYTGNHLLDGILQRLETGPPSWGEKAWSGFKSGYRSLMPAGVRGRLRGRLARGLDEAVMAAKRRDRRAFAVSSNENAGAIYVNLIGRDPHGTVAPGAEYEALCATLAEELTRCVNLDTGKPLVRQVVRVADMCHGERLDELPDLLVVWNRDGPIERVRSPSLGAFRRAYPGSRTGDHTANCAVFVSGPTVTPGKLDAAPAVADLPATLAALLGETLPGAEGSPIGRLFAHAEPGGSGRSPNGMTTPR